MKVIVEEFREYLESLDSSPSNRIDFLQKAAKRAQIFIDANINRKAELEPLLVQVIWDVLRVTPSRTV